jgi:hypothetical protein
MPGDRIYVPSRSFLEDFHKRKGNCPPCDKLHLPCVIGGPGCELGVDAAPGVVVPAAPEPRLGSYP